MLQLKRFRELAELSQKEVANLINKTPQAYNFYEQGKREPDLATLTKLADIFNVSVDTLLNHTPVSSSSTHHLTVSKDENHLLQRYRMLRLEKQKSVIDYVDFLFEQERDAEPQPKRNQIS